MGQLIGKRVQVVDASEASATQNDSKTGTTTDAWSAEVTFDAICYEIEVYAFDNALEIILVNNEGTDQDSLTVTKNGFRSWEFAARGFKVRSKTAGLASNYEITAWYKG